MKMQEIKLPPFSGMEKLGHKVGLSKRIIPSWMIRIEPEAVVLPCPGREAEAKLTVHKENGVVRTLEYRCACGHTDRFICE